MLYQEKERQKELFDEYKAGDKGFKMFRPSGKIMQNRIFVFQLPIEKIVFLFIILVMLGIIVFCFGVERGKRIAAGSKPIVIIKQVKPIMQEPQQPVINKKPGAIYTIRIAAYAGKKSAADEASRIRQAGFPAYVKASGRFHVICVGDYADKKQAEAALAVLKKKYKDSYIKTSKK